MAVLEITLDLSRFAGFGFDQASAEATVQQMIGDEIAGWPIIKRKLTIAPADRELTLQPEDAASTPARLTLIQGGKR